MTVTFNGGTALTQWDTGRTLTTADDYTWVDYQIAGIAGCVRVPMTSKSAAVPNIVLTRSGQLTILFVAVDTDGHRTVHRYDTFILKRAKPTDYVYSDEDYIDVHKLVNDLSERIDGLEIDSGFSAIGAAIGQVPTANGNGGWSWQNQNGGSGGGDVTIPDDLEERLSDIESAITELQYVPVGVSSFAITPNIAEVGSIVESVQCSWTTTGTPTSVKIDGTTVTGTSKTIAGPFTSNKTFTIVAADSKGTSSKSAYLTFARKIYYGSAVNSGDYVNIKAAIQSSLQTGRGVTFTASASETMYAWYMVHTSYGTPSFASGGFTGGFQLVGTTGEYNVWRSDNPGINATVTVS